MVDYSPIAPYAAYFTRPQDAVIADLESYAALMLKWQTVQNLVSRETLDEVWTRHFADSLQVLKLLRPTDKLIVDMGSGGGFPALPLAIALKGAPEAIRDFFFANMSSRAAQNMKDDMGALGPVRLKDVDEAQSLMVNVAKDMAARGEIIISKNRGGDDELVY